MKSILCTLLIILGLNVNSQYINDWNDTFILKEYKPKQDTISVDLNVKFNAPSVLLEKQLSDDFENDVISVLKTIPLILRENTFKNNVILESFGYSKEQILEVIKKDKIIKFMSIITAFILTIIYTFLLFLNSKQRDSIRTHDLLLLYLYKFCIFFSLYFILKITTTYIFNPDLLTILKLLEIQT